MHLPKCSRVRAGLPPESEPSPSLHNKSEIRISKSETILKSEIRNTKPAPVMACFGFSISCFGFVSDFEIRISDFAIHGPCQQNPRTELLGTILAWMGTP